MVEQIRRKAREIVLQEEHVEEFRVPDLHRDVPGQCYRKVQHDARDPKCAYDGGNIPNYDRKHDDDHSGEKWREWAFREHPESQETIEQRQVTLAAALIPVKPGEQGDRTGRSEGHLHGRGARKSNHSCERRRYQGAIELEARAESSQKEINGKHHQCGINC